jgi:hypothetical protein
VGSTMSGVEAAGLVLGAVPILISSLERLRRLGAKSSRTQRDYQRLRHELDLNLVLFRRTLEVLFADSLQSNELNDLLSNPTSPQWQSPNVEAALRRALGTAYPDFLDLTVQIFETVSSIESIFRKITDGPKSMTAVKTVFLADRLSNQLEALQALNSGIKILAESVNLRQLQAIENLGASLVKFQEFQEVAQRAERRAENSVHVEIEVNAGVNLGHSLSLKGSEYGNDDTASSYAESWVSPVVSPMI